ncbi:19875_t:CDS:2, partial [Racocetra fulgida]
EIAKGTSFNLLDLLLISNTHNDSSEYIEGEQPMNNDEIRSNLAEVTAAFIETTASALSFLIYNVAKNPSILKNIHEEIFKVFGSDINSVVTYDNLEKCHYITALIKETLRHTSPAPINVRALEGEGNTDKY